MGGGELMAGKKPVFGVDRDPGVVAALPSYGGRGYPKVPLSKQPNPMVVVHGLADPARICGDCRFLVWKGGHAHRYYGCEQRGKMTHGPATDHLVNWPACSLFEEQTDA
jgi:hypothetical protein